MGLFALSLHWLTPLEGALCALTALGFNYLVLPRIGGRRLERPEEKARGYSGMIGYPVVVLILMVLSFNLLGPKGGFVSFPDVLPESLLVWFSRESLAVAGAAWALLAFGDAFGALFGMFLKGPALPWNPGKRWTGLLGFLLAGYTSAYLVAGFIHGGSPVELTGFPVLLLFAAVFAGIVESLPGQIDDNLTVPLAAWIVLQFQFRAWWEHWQDRVFGVWSPAGDEFVNLWIIIGLLAVNTALALMAFGKGWVDRNGLLIGLFVGVCVIVGMGWLGYAFLLLFYLVSNGMTHYGKSDKESRGIAEPHGGQRRAGSVFSKGFVPALFALFSPPAFVAALAVYTADTVATEVGKTSRGRTLSLLRFHTVPAGTQGGVSLTGTLSGMGAILLFSGACGLLRFIPEASADLRALSSFGFSVLVAGTVWFLLESLINEVNSRVGFLSKECVHLFVGGFAGVSVYLPDTIRWLWPSIKLMILET